MKMRLGVFTILFFTATIIGIIYIALNQPFSNITTPKPHNVFAHQNANEKAPPLHSPKSAFPPKKTDDPKDSAGPDLSPEDKATILSIAHLDDDKMAKEIQELSFEISQNELFLQLESGQLSKEFEQQAREKLERFALLNLETKRRRHLDSDPEMKDPLVAHAHSLAEIRQALNDDD